MKHKHCDLIKAWADGAQIQCRSIDGYWVETNATPAWYPHVEYRIAPEPINLRFRVGLFHDPGRLIPYWVEACKYEQEGNPFFVRWVEDDWRILTVP